MYRNPADVRHIKRLEGMLVWLLWALGIAIVGDIVLFTFYCDAALEEQTYVYACSPIQDSTRVEIHVFLNPVQYGDTLITKEQDTIVVLTPKHVQP